MQPTGRSWLIPSKKLFPETTILSDCNSQVPLDAGRIGRIDLWDNTHWGKWRISLYMVRFDTTILSLMYSSWNWDTMRNYIW
jgi:hypothetical protein